MTSSPASCGGPEPAQGSPRAACGAGRPSRRPGVSLQLDHHTDVMFFPVFAAYFGMTVAWCLSKPLPEGAEKRTQMATSPSLFGMLGKDKVACDLLPGLSHQGTEVTGARIGRQRMAQGPPGGCSQDEAPSFSKRAVAKAAPLPSRCSVRPLPGPRPRAVCAEFMPLHEAFPSKGLPALISHGEERLITFGFEFIQSFGPRLEGGNWTSTGSGAHE